MLVGRLVTGLRLAGHVLGGVCGVHVGGVVLRHGGLPRAVAWLGLIGGALMTVNVIAPATQMPLFLLLPVWFVLVGVGLGRDAVNDAGAPPAADLRGAMA